MHSVHTVGKPKISKDKQTNKSNPINQWMKEDIGAYAANIKDDSATDTNKPNQVSSKTSGQTVAISGKDTKNTKKCLFCQEVHLDRNCPYYLNIGSRIERLKELNKCTKCCIKHEGNCKLRKCPRCKNGLHHSFLCPSIEKESYQSVCSVETSQNSDSVALPTGIIQLVKGKKVSNTRTLFDNGSQRSFISKNLVEQLGLKPVGRIYLKVTGFVGESEYHYYDIVNVTTKVGKVFHKVKALVKDTIIPDLKVDGLTNVSEYLKRKKTLMEMDIKNDLVQNVELLIGADYCCKFIMGMTRCNGVNLLRTREGFIIYGKIPSKFRSLRTPQNVALVANIAAPKI